MRPWPGWFRRPQPMATGFILRTCMALRLLPVITTCGAVPMRVSSIVQFPLLGGRPSTACSAKRRPVSRSPNPTHRALITNLPNFTGGDDGA